VHYGLTSPGQRVADLRKARQELQDARFQGVLTFRDQNGEQVTYKTDAEMAAALKAIDAEIARLEGRSPASTILFRTSKGI
jgi:hypothetical protein